MTEYSSFNIVYRLQKWIDSVPGQTFLNYAYSWGASIVILGTLFKLTHLDGANIMLFVGMGTEVVVFFISAFDRPFDKTAIGKELPTHIDDEEMSEEPISSAPNIQTTGGTVIITGNGATGQVAAAAGAPAPADSNGTNVVLGESSVNPELIEAQSNYIDELNKLTETLQKVSEQSERLTRDSEEMETLNRTLTGICRVYEMQLKSASQQIGTIDQINEQSRKMAAQIEQLNSIYTRMIEAMTVNMRAAAPNAGANQ
ncbi:MAG: gliding motility protein GldL [Prevotella sp.]